MERQSREGSWASVAAATLALAVSSGPLLQFSFAVFIQPVTTAFGSDRATISLALAAGMFAAGLATPVAGALMDRYGIRLITLPATILLALALAAIGLLAVGPMTYLGLYIVAGLLSAALAPLPFAKSITARFDRRRGLAIGIAMAGVGIGAALLPQAVRLMIDDTGWRGAYVGLAAIILLIGLPGAFVGLPSKGGSGDAVTVNLPGVTGREAVTSPHFRRLAIAFFLMAMACNGMVAHLVVLLGDRDGGGDGAVLALSASGVAIILGRLLSGALLDRYAPNRVASGFFLFPLAGILILGMTHLPGWIGAALIGIGLGAEVDLIAFLISRFFGRRAYGTIFGSMFLIFTMGSAVGPLIMGISYQITSYLPAMIIFVVLLIVGSIICFFLDNSYSHKDEASRP